MAEKGDRGRLLFFPLPLQGHVTPMLQLADIFHSKGFSVTIIHTKYNSPDPSNYPNFTFIPISDGLSEKQASELSIFALASILNVNCLEPFRDCLIGLLSEDSEVHTTCLISDTVLHFTREVAESFKLPRFVLRTSSVSVFRAFAAIPFLREKKYLPIQASRLEELVPELPPLRIKDLPVRNVPNEEMFYQLIAGLVDEARTSSGVIFNSFEELEQSAIAAVRQEFPAPIFPVGPFHQYFSTSSSSLVKPDETSISWLDTQSPKSVIYVSFGSVAAVKEKEFLEIAWGLANCGHPFLWVIRPGSIHGSNGLESLPSDLLATLGERGHIVKWAAQLEVLEHPAIGAFWTHNGWNSTLESICAGVPMICMPCFTDQFVNARYVTHVWRVGLQLESGLERKAIGEVVRRLMEDEDGEEIRNRAEEFKEKASTSLKPGGSSYETLEGLISSISSS